VKEDGEAMQSAYLLIGSALLAFVSACDGDSEDGAVVGGGASGNAGSSGGGASGGASGGGGPIPGGGSGGYIDFGDGGSCPRTTCAQLGWACGYTVDMCGNVVDCEEEGLACGPNQVCVGGIDGPTVCAAGIDPNCELCTAVPDCGAGAQLTRLTGRVITPGRGDTNTGNQVGVPNALVYIMKTDDLADLPAIPTGIPTGGLACDRCEDQELGPLLAGGITDAFGNFAIEGNVPVGAEFLLVVKAGKFRRVVRHPALPAEAACQTTALPTTLPGNPTRLPRSTSDGDAVNIPKIAVTTGRIDAMECVFEKMGVAPSEFGNYPSAAKVHLYRGTGESGSPEGARVDDSTPDDIDIYGSLERLQSYDMVVSDCEGGGWDGRDGLSPLFPQRIAHGAKIREYVNRGGRLFASHLSMSWLNENGTTAWSEADPIATGLGAASTWDIAYRGTGNLDGSGTGVVSLVGTRPQVSPRIESFASWLVNEGVTTAPAYEFTITDPRSLTTGIGTATEEFVYRSNGNQRVQQFSFDTPYGAPEGASCGRVAYSGFHVAVTGGVANPFATSVFPTHCTGDLTNQEKVLLYMLFDLGACVGDEPVPPPCVPITCNGASGRRCGFTPDGCGQVLDCGPCRPPA
jgi:hypothetical protein